MQTTDNLGANKLTEKELSIAIIGGTGDLGSDLALDGPEQAILS